MSARTVSSEPRRADSRLRRALAFWGTVGLVLSALPVLAASSLVDRMTDAYLAPQHQAVEQLRAKAQPTQPDASLQDVRCVLHALRDWLSTEEMTDLSSQLPVLVRGIYFENWKPLDTPVWERKKEDFIARVEDAFSGDMLNDPDEAVRAVFRLLDRHISHGEIVQVRNSMKKPLRDLWPAA